ncbi:hypothetical protein [Aromatoleum bremense]|uniref:hypothetical protein n=1 Tax=Aromatoleum bremense TaxID=76115 RepID=UPI001AEBF6A8|nr:hypothetical protein [Aromatoleum bremense]QTQ30366.1 Uncharacterized protein pbN1_03740 [Aromatoleum bremense]
MERRDFLKGMLGSGALAGAPLGALAAAAAPADAGTGIPVTIVSQVDLPFAAALAGRIAGSLEATGIRVARLAPHGNELGRFASVMAILDGARNGHLIGVMDDASAVIVQQLAASRGAACAIQTHHRVSAGGVRSCCTVAGLESNLVWSDGVASPADRIGRLYAQAVGRGRAKSGSPAGVAKDAFASASDASAASLVSFVINTSSIGRRHTSTETAA